MTHAVGQERVLLAHDFACHLDDGARPLVEALHQPVPIVQAIGQIGLVLTGSRDAVHFGEVARIHEHAGQRVGIELDVPASIGAFAHIDVGNDRLHGLRTEGQSGPGVELADFRNHFRDVGNIQGA